MKTIRNEYDAHRAFRHKTLDACTSAKQDRTAAWARRTARANYARNAARWPTRLAVALAALTLIGLVGAVLALNHDDALQQARTYCQRVAAGDWPDFHHSYTAECEATFGPAEPFVPYTERK